MSKLTKNIDEHFSPLILKVQELSTQIAGVCATPAVQKIQIDNAFQVFIASQNYGVEQATTLNTLEESSEAEFIPKVCDLNSKSKDNSNGSANTGIDPKYKLSFTQMFDPKTSIIASFLPFMSLQCVERLTSLRKNIF
ncbi:hypothetical protein DSO57_1011612 [Entomophthora muscae]|uniref:Uncharacterized protein n=1 Tax=Entomophthora muscae TaxID=34485 RepID=A0ACC2URK3_9FUNG|nr:hypothetical protein DSO57_1011612 [Entomophthora muscae]